MKIFFLSFLLFIVSTLYIVLYQAYIPNSDVINHEDVNSLSKDQQEVSHGRLLEYVDNQCISKKEFNSLSKKKKKIIITWIITNSKIPSRSYSKPELMEQSFVEHSASLYSRRD